MFLSKIRQKRLCQCSICEQSTVICHVMVINNKRSPLKVRLGTFRTKKETCWIVTFIMNQRFSRWHSTFFQLLLFIFSFTLSFWTRFSKRIKKFIKTEFFFVKNYPHRVENVSVFYVFIKTLANRLIKEGEKNDKMEPGKRKGDKMCLVLL